MKMLHLIAPILVVMTCGAAQANVQLVSMPMQPLSLPTRIVPEAVTLPTRIDPQSISLPSSPMYNPLGPAKLPSAPVSIPTVNPGVKLPGPKTIPLLPTTLASGEGHDGRGLGQKLEKIYDGRRDDKQPRRGFTIGEDPYHRIPEQELVDEIGIGSY